jgi:hypothetical protein
VYVRNAPLLAVCPTTHCDPTDINATKSNKPIIGCA